MRTDSSASSMNSREDSYASEPGARHLSRTARGPHQRLLARPQGVPAGRTRLPPRPPHPRHGRLRAGSATRCRFRAGPLSPRRHARGRRHARARAPGMPSSQCPERLARHQRAAHARGTGRVAARSSGPGGAALRSRRRRASRQRRGLVPPWRCAVPRQFLPRSKPGRGANGPAARPVPRWHPRRCARQACAHRRHGRSGRGTRSLRRSRRRAHAGERTGAHAAGAPCLSARRPCGAHAPRRRSPLGAHVRRRGRSGRCRTLLRSARRRRVHCA